MTAKVQDDTTASDPEPPVKTIRNLTGVTISFLMKSETGDICGWADNTPSAKFSRYILVWRPASDGNARVHKIDRIAGSYWIDDVELKIHEVLLGKVVDLPEPAEDTWYIVTQDVADAVSARRRKAGDLLVASGAVYDVVGNLIGYTGFNLA